ncbi:MAG: ATP-binding protein [Thermoguttaceae bacterium]|jgi:two-component system sensor kinase FixL
MSDSSDHLIANFDAICRAAADCSTDLICLATTHGEPFYFNPATRRALGLTETEEIPSAGLHSYYSKESWNQLRDVAVPMVNRTGHWEGSTQLRNVQTDELTDVETFMFRVKPAQADMPGCLAIIHRMGGPCRQLREAFEEAQARKHAILESSLDPIITINHEGVIIEFNRAAETAFGFPRDKVLGTRPADVLFPPSAGSDHGTRIDRYLESGEGSMLGKRAEVIAVRANGESFPAEVAITMSQEQGAPVLSLFIRDISLRRKAEEQQAQYAAELVRSNRDLEQFAYVASHDLQEPLRKIRAFGDRLEMKCAAALDDTGRECVQRMQTAAARMQQLIEGLLTLSRVTTRAQDFMAVDLGEIARQVVSDLEAQLQRVEGRVQVGNLPTIQADPLQMRQLLQNLIGNALKFHRPEESPVVKIEGRFVQGRRRQAGDSPAHEQCRIVVEDNGIGFDEKHAERIFGVFQRLHPRDVYEGTGIGLAICRKIVELHGGTIAGSSTPGKGARFEVLLPVMQPARKPGPSDGKVSEDLYDPDGG